VLTVVGATDYFINLTSCCSSSVKWNRKTDIFKCLFENGYSCGFFFKKWI